jgi:hypothetical protein
MRNIDLVNEDATEGIKSYEVTIAGYGAGNVCVYKVSAECGTIKVSIGGAGKSAYYMEAISYYDDDANLVTSIADVNDAKVSNDAEVKKITASTIGYPRRNTIFNMNPDEVNPNFADQKVKFGAVSHRYEITSETSAVYFRAPMNEPAIAPNGYQGETNCTAKTMFVALISEMDRNKNGEGSTEITLRFDTEDMPDW